MTDVDRLLTEYIEAHRSGGEADPTGYLSQVEGTDREQLIVLIDAYLARAPRRDFDPDAYRGSPAEFLVESWTESLGGVSGSWPVLLPELRNKVKLRREDLVGRLAEALGVGGKQEKVAYYYNAMEHGRLEPDGVSDRVLDALASIVDTTRDALRRGGEAVTPAVEADLVFARKARLDDAFEQAPASMASPTEGAEEARDEVDELFLGG